MKKHGQLVAGVLASGFEIPEFAVIAHVESEFSDSY